MINNRLTKVISAGFVASAALCICLRALLADTAKTGGSVQKPLQMNNAGNAARSNAVGSVAWNSNEYSIADGIDVLMASIENRQSSANERARALMALSGLGTKLRGHPCLQKLANRFDESSYLEKLIIVSCFKASADPSGLPLYSRILDGEKDMKLRFRAASGLADWNVRRGVGALVRLLDSTEMFPPPMLPYVRDNAMRTFRLTNIHKGWGFPDDKESAKAPPDMIPPPEVAARLKPPPTVEEIKKWWSENEHRFPEWKPGDPLPEVEAGQQDPGEANDQ